MSHFFFLSVSNDKLCVFTGNVQNVNIGLSHSVLMFPLENPNIIFPKKWPDGMPIFNLQIYQYPGL